LQITNSDEEQAQLKEHEATQQKQTQQAQWVINQLQKQLKAKNQQVSTVLEYQIAEKQEQLTNLLATLTLVPANQEKIHLIQEEIRTLQEVLTEVKGELKSVKNENEHLRSRPVTPIPLVPIASVFHNSPQQKVIVEDNSAFLEELKTENARLESQLTQTEVQKQRQLESTNQKNDVYGSNFVKLARLRKEGFVRDASQKTSDLKNELPGIESTQNKPTLNRLIGKGGYGEVYYGK